MVDPNSTLFVYGVLPLLIFLARIVDVSIGTLRIVYIARGKQVLAPLLGFVEVLIWLAAMNQIFNHLDNLMCYFAFAGGFASGNYVGMVIEGRLALGTQLVRVITRNDANGLLDKLRDAGHGFTVVDGQGASGPVQVIFTVLRRRDVPRFLKLVGEHKPKAFYTIEDIHSAREALQATPLRTPRADYWHRFRMDRKRK